MTGKMFEHVEHIGSGLPSAPLGTSRFGGGSLLTSTMAGADGLALNIRGSASSFLTSASSFCFPFRVVLDKGVGTGVDTCDAFWLPFPLSLPFPRLDDNRMADAERVKRFVGVSGSSDGGGVINCFAGVGVGVEDALAFWPRVEIMERNRVDWLLFGVEGRSSADDKEVRADDERVVIAGDKAVRADGAGDAISGVGNEEGPATAELDCPREGGNDVRSEAVSTSASSSISPPAAASFKTGTTSSASLSLSSESSSPSGMTA
jgi:hypothetical protein